MNDDLDLGAIFQEPVRPPSPDPTVATYGTLRVRLVGSHPLWGHYLWNSARSLADFIDRNSLQLCKGKSVLELGAGGGLPGLVAALKGASYVMLTDYPDPSLISNLECNVRTNIPPYLQNTVDVRGYIWGAPISQLGDSPSFDLVILSDLLFNHSQHDALLKTCEQALKQGPNASPCMLVFYTHHRPHLVERDLDFFRKAQERGWQMEEIVTERHGAMFPDDPGDEEVRAVVHGWKMWRNTA